MADEESRAALEQIGADLRTTNGRLVDVCNAIEAAADLVQVPLRDYFAAAALQGYLAGCGGHLPEDTPQTDARVAQRAYRFADVMLEARHEKGGR